MILQAFYKQKGQPCPFDLSPGAVGITGVGAQLLEQLFTPPVGLDPALARAIDEFMAQKNERETRIKDLTAKAAAGLNTYL